MRFAILSAVAVAGLALSAGAASAQHRGVARGPAVIRTQSLTPQVGNTYRAPNANAFNSSSFPVTPYNAGLADLSRNYGPNYRGGYVPPSGGFLGFSAGGGLSNGYYGGGGLPSYGRFSGRRW